MGWEDTLKIIQEMGETPCPTGEKWCPQCRKCEPIEEWNQHNLFA